MQANGFYVGLYACAFFAGYVLDGLVEDCLFDMSVGIGELFTADVSADIDEECALL